MRCFLGFFQVVRCRRTRSRHHSKRTDIGETDKSGYHFEVRFLKMYINHQRSWWDSPAFAHQQA